MLTNASFWINIAVEGGDTIKTRIREVREHFNLSQAQFGERIGVSRDVIGNLEYGRLKNSSSQEPLIKLICKEFGVNEIWLRSGEGEMQKPISASEELDLYSRKIFNRELNEFEEMLIRFMANTSQEEWKLLEAVFDRFLETKKKTDE